ncbi:hypothetical protein EWB00_004888 [Schistosoma japonicum]|uniref:Uncharacterized protein n=1 Tax=Schistosoma japonicum TaxID=6182 RepID=A0A4Z2D3T1_SCHJA|nr:hypothetical protein EWB00_004888 [Schistosoma japonicum]
MYWIYIESLVLRSKIHKCNWRHVHNSSTTDSGVKEDRVDFVALFCSIIMITPNESQHSLNTNAFQSVSANLYHPPATRMAVFAASQSHCTRPSSVPGCFAHREGFSVSTKNRLSPVNSDNLSPYFKISPTYQSSLSPVSITCNKHASPDVRAGNHEVSEKDYIPVNSPQSTLVTQDSGKEGCKPSPFHHSDSPHYPCCSSASNSPISVKCNVKSESLSSFDFPKLCLKSDGGFNLNLPTDVILPECSNNRGQDAWNYHQRLMDVIITVVNQSGQILYHEKYFPSQHGLCLGSNDNAENDDNESYFDFANLQIDDDSWSGRIQDCDLEIWEEHTSKIFKEASRWLHARNALFDDALPNNNCEVADQHYQQQPSSIDSSKNSRNRHLFDCPVYRLKLGRKLFYVHTFSLPIVSHSDSHLQSSELSLCEPLVVHYHSILRECDQSGELTGSNASACLKKAIAQSTSALSITASGCSFVLNTIVPHSSSVTCSEKSVSSSHLTMPLVDVNGRITTEVSNCGNNKDAFLPISHCHSHVNSPDLPGRRRTLVSNTTSSSSMNAHVLPHYHHVHLTHHHHHHSNPIHDGTTTTTITTATTTTNPLSNHPHRHHHHYVRHHHHLLPNTLHGSPQPTVISHHPHQNNVREKFTWSSNTSHDHTHHQKVISADSIECNSTLHHTDSSNCQSTANQYQPLLDPLHHHHHHHHHPHIHTGQNSHNTYNPYFHQNDKSTITEFVPTSTSTLKSASPIVVRKSSARYHSGHLPTVDSNAMIQYENMDAIETFCDNNTNNYSLPSNISNRSSESVFVHSDSELVSSCRHNEINSCSTTFHCNSNNNTAIVCLSPNTSGSLSVTPLTNSHSPPQNNESISSKESVADDNSTESFLYTLNNNTTTDHDPHHVDSSNTQQRSLNKNQYDRRILMLQHLLPPQAVQEIRQIWQEMNKNLKCDTEVPGISLKLPMATRVSAAATSPPNSLSHSVSSSVREHFARRVRQVVRQYLGPKAFITDNLSESQSETESCFKTNIVFPQPDRCKNSASELDYNESRRHSTLIPIISSPIEEKCVSLPSSIIGSITATTFTSSFTISPSDGKSSSSSRNNTPSTTEVFSSEITARKLSHSGVSELTESNVGVLLCPNVVSAATSKINDVQKVSSPCGIINNSPCMKQGDELMISQSNDRSVETVVTTTSADTLDASDLPRVSTSSSQCCMLEWLLSEEADLCLLPPSLCQSKIVDKLQQSTSMTSPPLLSSVSCSQIILPTTPCCIPSNQTHNFQYGSPITEIAHSPLSVLQPKVNSEQQTSNRSLLSSTNTSLITTMTTTSANTASIITIPPPSTNIPHVEIRSSPQPRTESLLVRLLHPAKSHSLGYTDMNTHDGTLPKLDSSVAVTSQLISDTIDFHCSNANTNTVSDANAQLQSSYNRKSEDRLIAASLNNLCDNQLTINTTTSKRCRSGPATTTQSISLSSSSHIISPGNKRTRHASQFEEIPPSGNSTRKYSGTKHNSDGIPSPPFTSLTQLLLQDFPMISDIMSYSPNSMDSPKYTTPLFGPVKSSSNEQRYENFQANSNLTTSFDKNKINRSDISQSDQCFFTQHPPCVISGDKCTKNQSLFNNSNDGLLSSTEQCHEKLLSLTSISSLPCSVKSKLENKDRHPVKISKESNIHSTNFAPVQSSICQLLLDAQLQPEEITDAVANVEKCSDLSFKRNNAFSINDCNKEESSSIEASSFKTNLQTTSTADKNQPFNKSFSSNCYMGSSSASMTSSTGQSIPQPSSYSIAPVEWNDDDLQQLIHEAITNPSDNILKENNNPRTNSPSPSLLPKRHPSTSSKEISEEVEILCEILRRDELERTNQRVTDCCQPLNQCDATIATVNSYNNNSMSHISESPSSKRSRFSSSTSISDHQLDASDNLVTIDSDSTYCKNEVTWQNDAKAVARICEQLQQGLVTEKSVCTSLNNNNNNTSASSNNSSEYSMSLNDMMISSTQTSTNYDLVSTNVIATCPTRSNYSFHTSGHTVQRHNSGNTGTNVVNKAAVAAALASQQAAASQRNQLTNQRLLAEQRKRLIQHQLYNQVAIYSLNSTATSRNLLRYSDLNPQVNTFFVSDNLPYGVQNLPSSIISTSPSACITNTTTTFTVNSSASTNNTNSVYPLLQVIPNKSSNRRSLCLDTNCTQNLNADILNLNATTVISSNSPSISSVSKGSHFYHHHPEDLSRFLKEVGPNVRVQLSCSIPTSNSNHHQLNNANKTQYVYHPTRHHNSGTMKMQQSPPRHQFTTKVLTTASSMFPHSQTTNIVLQSGIASSSSLSSYSSYRTPLTASVCSNPFTSVHNPKAISSDESVLDSSHQFPLADNTNTINNTDNSRILKSELRQALVDRQGIYRNNAAITTDSHRSFKYFQVSDQLSDPFLSLITYHDCSSNDIDQLPLSSSCLSSSSLPYVSRLPTSLVLNQTVCSTADPMNCRQLSLPQPVYIHQEIPNSNPSSCNTYPQSVQSVRSYHHSQGFPSIHKTDTFDFFTQNDSSQFNTTLNHSNVVCPLTPCSLSPISVSANTSPCSSTTSQPPGFLKSPTCQQSTELAYSSTSDTLLNNYYEANSTESLDCCFSTYSNYPTLHRSISTVSSSSTLSYNPLSRLQDHDNQDNAATTVIDPYLDSSMLPSNYKQQYYHQQQQQHEENLLPDDLINDVFDLEIMIAAKQKQEQQQYYQQYHYQNPTTHGLDFLTSPTPPPDTLIIKQPLLSTATFNNNNRVVSQPPPPTIMLNSTNQCTAAAATVVVVVTR